MFKPESWQSHDEYRTIVNTFGRRLSRNNPKYSFHEYDEERRKLLNPSLNPLPEYIHHQFLFQGRMPGTTSGADPALPDTFCHAFQ